MASQATAPIAEIRCECAICQASSQGAKQTRLECSSWNGWIAPSCERRPSSVGGRGTCDKVTAVDDLLNCQPDHLNDIGASASCGVDKVPDEQDHVVHG